MFNKLKKLFSPDKAVDANKRFSILVVEDTEVDRSLIERTLAREGYKVYSAQNGVQGLELARINSPDIVVLDCEMPQMNGIEMCRQLKADKRFHNIPVIFLTSLDTPKNVVDCFETEAANFLNKPLNPQVLIKEIKAILQESKQT